MLWLIFWLIVLGVLFYYIDSPGIPIAAPFKLAIKVIAFLIALYIVFCFVASIGFNEPFPHARF